MRILIAGGSGFLGRALCQKLDTEGYEVIVLSRNPNKFRSTEKIKFVEWDAKTTKDWKHLVGGAFAVINLAGETIGQRWTKTVKSRIRESRLKAGHALVQAISEAQKKPEVFVQASAVGYYGPRGKEIITEDEPYGKDFLALLVKDWEDSTFKLEKLGMRRVIIRTGLVLGKGGMLNRLLLPFKFFVGGTLGNGKQGWSWIHIEDWVEAVYFLLKNKEAKGPFNLTAPEPLSNYEFSKILGDVLKRPAWLPIPSLLLRIILGEGADPLLHGQFVYPARLITSGFQFRYPNLNSALQTILKSSA